MDKFLHTLICNLTAVAEVDVVEVLAEFRNGMHGGISDVATFG